MSRASRDVAPVAPDVAGDVRLGGLTLAQAAGVVAALAEDLPLDVVLAREGIGAAAWPVAWDAWRSAIAQAPDLQVRWVERLRQAEDCLGRSVDPLDDDAAAWAGLLSVLVTGRDPSARLRGLGLRMSDVARIGRAWRDKAARDPEIAKALADAAGVGAAPIVVRCGPTTFARFPWSPASPSVPATNATAPVGPPDARIRRREGGALPVTRDVDLFAALEVVLELEPEERPRALALVGLEADEHAAVAARWKQRFARSPELRAQFVARSGDHRAALRRLLRGAAPRFEDGAGYEARRADEG